jgi:hypothetical protein
MTIETMTGEEYPKEIIWRLGKMDSTEGKGGNIEDINKEDSDDNEGSKEGAVKEKGKWQGEKREEGCEG